MAEIHINNPQALIEQASNVAQLSNNIARVQEDLLVLCQQISKAWQSNTVDKETYLSSLNKSLKKVEGLTLALSALSKNLQAYAQNQINTANG